MKRITTWAFAALLTGLVGCVGYDQGGYSRNRGYHDDSAVSAAVQSNLRSRGFRHVDVAMVDGTVVLEGRVPDSDARRQAGRIARRTYGVQHVVNNLEIRSSRAGDAPFPGDSHRPPWHRDGH